MPFLVAAAAGALLGLALGGRPANLAQLRLRAWWLLLPPLAWRLLQLVVGEEAAWLQAATPWVFAATVLLLLVFAAANLDLAGMPLIALGAALNALVVGVNGGRMPIPLAVVSSLAGPAAARALAVAGGLGNYVATGPDTRLAWLGDVLLVPGPVPRALSVGDVAMMAGLVVGVAALLVNKPSPLLGLHFPRAGRRFSSSRRDGGKSARR